MDDFETFYRKNVRLVHRLMLSRTGDIGQAEDLTQDTFLRAWRHFGILGDLEAPAQRAWLIRTARNLSVDAWRRRSLDDGAPAALVPPVDDAALSELRLDVGQALAELDESDRELMIMRYLQEMNSREIGEALEMPEGTVRRRLARCRELLAQHLSQWAGNGGGQ